jgi:hypothetical protein
VAKKKRLRVLTTTAAAPAVESLLADCLRTDSRAEQHRSLSQLARQTTSPQQIAGLLYSLKSSGQHGPRLALEFLLKLEADIPTVCLPLVTQLLADRRAPVHARMSVAARLLEEQSDRMDSTVQITRAVTTGLSRSRVLQRLLELQSLVTMSKTLDELVAEQQQRVKLRCPVCRKACLRAELIVHLWSVHQLTFDAGVTLDPAMTLQRLIDTTLASTDAVAMEAAFTKASVLRRDWTDLDLLRSLSDPTGTIPATLTRHAADHNAGLCSKCLLELPDALPELPPPVSVGSGRLSGDGYAVEVRDSQLGRVVRVVTPQGTEDDAPASTNRYSPRAAAVWIACPSLLVGLLVAFRVPPSIGPMLLLVTVTLLVSIGTYVLVRMLRTKLVNRSELALDVAWQRMAGTLDATPESARWVVRLCRASWNRGDAEERRTPLFHLSNQAEALADVSSVHEQALAACRLLQVMDETDQNGQRTRQLLKFFTDFLDGQRSPVFLEAVAEMLQDQEFFLDAERRRHPPLAIAAAFAAGWIVEDLRMLFHTLPFTRQWFGQPSEALLRQLFSIWQWRDKQPWATFGTGTSILELATKHPSVARRILQRTPSATMKIELDDATDKELLDVLLTEFGVLIRGVLFNRPQELRVERSSRGTGWVLFGGAEPVQLDRGLKREAIGILQRWVRWYDEHAVKWATATDIRPTTRTRRMLKTLLCECPECGTHNVVRRGRLSDAMPEAGA